MTSEVKGTDKKNVCAVVFGGSGFIGRHLVRTLKREGYKRVVSADLRPSAHPIEGVEYLICDVRRALTGIVEGRFDEVYNLAAVHTTPGHADHEYYDTNVSGAINIVKFCEQHGVKTLFFTSSISVYGPSEDPVNEASPCEPISAYGKSKLLAESIHELWARSAEIRKLIVARLAVIFGPGENGNFTRLGKALSTGFFFFPGRRDTIKGCAHVDEVLRAYRFAEDRPERIYTFNVAYPYPYTLEEICEAFQKIGNLPRPRGTVPTCAMLLATLLLEFMSWIGLKNPVCRARVQKLVNSTYVVPERLLSDGYKFDTDLEKGLRRWLDARIDGRFV